MAPDGPSRRASNGPARVQWSSSRADATIGAVKAVMLDVDPALLEQRRRLGLDRRDEMWEGVLHMVPAPANEHQRILDELIMFLGPLLKGAGRGVLRSGINVFDEASPSESYRIPDLTFVAAGREALFAADGIRGGGPDAVIEIFSPNDESYEKLPFYAKLGVREAIVVDRDTKTTEIIRRVGDRYEPVAPDPDGSVASEVLGVCFAVLDGARLLVSDAADRSVSSAI
jgi:Uma2 family endonuclease